jgi:adenylate cyclase class IV
MLHNYEIEIKSLLGSKENADALVSKLKESDPELKLVSEGKQLNHYFVVPHGIDMKDGLQKLISEENKPAFEKILQEGKNISVRTRDSNGKVIFVMKASLDADSSANGVKRIEFESVVPMSLDALDAELLAAGLTYQAKWSRERKEYTSGDMHVCIDKNAGYGYLAEFEKVVTDEAVIDETKKNLLSFMEKMGVCELAQDRLERMFAHYNAHWPEYYGTENIFTIL